MKFDISKKQFNARLTIFNVSLIFCFFYRKGAKAVRNEVAKNAKAIILVNS